MPKEAETSIREISTNLFLAILFIPFGTICELWEAFVGIAEGWKYSAHEIREEYQKLAKLMGE